MRGAGTILPSPVILSPEVTRPVLDSGTWATGAVRLGSLVAGPEEWLPKEVELGAMWFTGAVDGAGVLGGLLCGMLGAGLGAGAGLEECTGLGAALGGGLGGGELGLLDAVCCAKAKVESSRITAGDRLESRIKHLLTNRTEPAPVATPTYLDVATNQKNTPHPCQSA
jgi:hypothetical protein